MDTILALPMKHIYIDVVGYTSNRSVEAQVNIIAKLNELVRLTTKDMGIENDKILYIPTGDGMCISLINIEIPYDIHVLYALKLLDKINSFNQGEAEEEEKFKIRIGINANCDNLILDINGTKNIAGAGINIASRVMSYADENQILLGKQVHEVLSCRKQYMNKLFEYKVVLKHGIATSIYQYRDNDSSVVNNNTPKAFQRAAPKKFDMLIACYICYGMIFREDLVRYKKNHDEYVCTFVLYGMARDEMSKMRSKEHEEPFTILDFEKYDNFKSLVDNFIAMPFSLQMVVSDLIIKYYNFYEYQQYFEDTHRYVIVKNNAIEKINQEYPELYARILDSVKQVWSDEV